MLHHSMLCLMQITEASDNVLHEHNALQGQVGMVAAPTSQPMMQPNVPSKWAYHACCEL